MPTNTIDMFFACTLVVSVAIIATAFLAGAMQNQISSMQDLNQEGYLQGIADHIVASCGTPSDWGSTNVVPASLGLSADAASSLYALDMDKISRFNNQNKYSLSYLEALNSAKLDNIALGISISQMLSINIEPLGNATVDDVTVYNFRILVSQDSGLVKANLHCYILAGGFQTDVSNITSIVGVGSITINIPNSANGPAMLVVFAQGSSNNKLCAYSVYTFAHASKEPQANCSFLSLSPLNSTLNMLLNYSDETVEKVYAFSYTYSANLIPISSGSYAIPDFVDKSPIVLVAQGTNGTTSFNEWVAYPQVPLTFGGNFSNSAVNAFTYTVTIDGVLYRLTLRFGDVAH